jgi:hypothetical protein
MYRRLSRPVRRGRVLRQGRAARPHRQSCRGACLTQTPAASLGWRHLSALGPSAPRAGPGARHSFFASVYQGPTNLIRAGYVLARRMCPLRRMCKRGSVTMYCIYQRAR